jgi:sulfide:quinone oxidoreductase
VTIPVLEGPRIPGLPCDDAGFIEVDAEARVAGVADVFAAGDVTAGCMKQGGLAAQQADAAAARIAWEAGAAVEPGPRSPVLRGMLHTGSEPLYFRVESGRTQVSRSPLWTPAGKVAGRFLAGYLAGEDPAVELEDLWLPTGRPAQTA